MCIFYYFEDKQNKIKALETYRQRMEAEEKDGNINNFPFIQTISEIIRKEKEAETRGAAIISSVSDPIARQLLIYRYIDRKTWQTIAEKLNYSERTIYRLSREALKLFDIAEAEAV